MVSRLPSENDFSNRHPSCLSECSRRRRSSPSHSSCWSTIGGPFGCRMVDGLATRSRDCHHAASHLRVAAVRRNCLSVGLLAGGDCYWPASNEAISPETMPPAGAPAVVRPRASRRTQASSPARRASSRRPNLCKGIAPVAIMAIVVGSIPTECPNSAPIPPPVKCASPCRYRRLVGQHRLASVRQVLHQRIAARTPPPTDLSCLRTTELNCAG